MSEEFSQSTGQPLTPSVKNLHTPQQPSFLLRKLQPIWQNCGAHCQKILKKIVLFLQQLQGRFIILPRRTKLFLGTAGAFFLLLIYFLPTLKAKYAEVTQPPRVIAVFPSSGAISVEREIQIEISFSRTMDQRSVEAAFSMQPEVKGFFEWMNKQRLIFKPQSPLEKDTHYLVTIDMGARAQNKKGLADLFSSDFTTQGNPKVIFASPLEKSELKSLITVMFDQPMVFLTTTRVNEQSEDILVIEPSIAGVGKWVGTSTFVFRPSQNLTPSTQYTVLVKKGLSSVSGDVFAEDYSFSFVTERPTIANLYYYDPRALTYGDGWDGYQSVYERNRLIEEMGPRQTWKIKFSLSIDRKSAQENFRLTLKENGQEIPVSFQWRSDQEVILTPRQQLAPLGVYQAKFNPGVKGEIGNLGLEQDFTWDFKVVDLPGLSSTTPAEGTQDWGAKETYDRSRVYLNFKTSMAQKDLETSLIVEPKPETALKVYADSKQVTLSFWQKPSTTYKITIPREIKDIFGRSLPQTYSFSFSTAPLPKTIGLLSSNYLNKYIAVQNAKIVPKVVGKVTNVSQINYELYRLSEEQILDLILEKANTSERARIWQNLDLGRFQKVHTWSKNFEVEKDVPVNVVTEVVKNGESFPPGFYFLEAKIEGGVHDNLLLVLSNTVLLVKTSPQQVFAWATDLSTTQPVSDLKIKLYHRNRSLLAEEKTNSDGVLQTQVNWPTENYGYPNEDFIAIGQKQNDAALVTWEFDEGIQGYDFGIYSGYYGQSNNSVIFLTLDRPLYRPGQKVYFKGYLRLEEDVSYSLPRVGEQVEIKIQSGYREGGQQEIYRKNLKVNEFGSFSDSLELSTTLATGEYYLEASYQGKNFTRAFRVEEYRKPEYQVEVTAHQKDYVLGEPAQVKLTTSYFGGGAVAGAPVTYRVDKRGDYFAWQEDSRFVFNEPIFLDYPYTNYRSSFVEGKNGEGVTDQGGEFQLGLKLVTDPEKEKDWQLLNYVVSMDVKDLNNQTVGAEVTFPVFRSSQLTGLRPSQFFGEKGQVSRFDVVTIDKTQKRTPHQNVNWEVYERVWNYIQELGEDGRYYSKSEPIDTLVTQGQLTTNDNALGSFEFTPKKAGYFVIKANTKDGASRTWQTALSYWVSSADELISFRKVDHDRIDLVLEKSEYQVGEKARILAPLPFKNAKGLVTVERMNVLSYQLVDLPVNSQHFEIEVKDRFIPNVFVTLTAVKGGESWQNVPEFRLGMTKILVGVEPKRLKLAIKTDKPRYSPREEVKYEVLAKDWAGQPVAGDFSLAVVDKALLSLSREDFTDILAKFFFERGLSIENFHSLIASLEKVITRAGLGDKGGSGAAGNGGEEGRDTSRKDFVDTVIFEANLRTNEQGKAEGSFTLPDNLTTFSLILVGADKKTRVGAVTQDILVARDLYLRPILPRFEVWGDELQLGVVVQNQTQVTQKVNVKVEAEGIVLTEKSLTKEVMVPSSGVQKLYWSAKVLAAEQAKVKYLAESVSGLSDSLELTLPLKRPTTIETTATGGQTETSVTESLFVPPGEVEVDLGELTIQISASLFNQLTGGFEFAQNYPYECIEQSVSRLLAAVLAKGLQERLGQGVLADLPNPEEIIQTALQRIYQQQKADGGWAYWVKDPRSDPFLSAYTLFSLFKTQEAGVGIDKTVYEKAKTYLSDQIQTNEGELSDNVSLQAYLLYVDSLVSGDSLSRTKNLYEIYLRKPTLFRLSTRAYLYLAIENLVAQSLNHRQVLEPIKGRLFNDLAGLTKITANTARWEQDFEAATLGSTTKATALMIEALLANSPQNPLLRQGLNYLLEIKKDGYWGTTQDTISVLLALTKYLAQVEKVTPNYSYMAKLDEEEILSGHFDQKRILEQDQGKVEIKQLAQRRELPLQLKKEGPGILYYNLNLRTFTPLSLIEPKDQGMAVERTYFDQSGKEIQEIKAGETVTARVTLIVPENRHQVVLEDYLPAGIEPINVSFATEHVYNQESLERKEESEGESGPVWFSHREMRDDRILVFVSFLPRGVYEFTYKARATTPGRFTILPARAFEMYQPDVFGASSISTFKVAP